MTADAGEAGPPPPHLDALTGMRGIAAWFVVLYHIRLSLTGLLPAPVIAALAKGYLAVDLFFVLSGFVLWYNYAPRLRAGSLNGDGLAQTCAFLWRRFARIWPLHAVILAAFVAFALMLFVTGRSTAGYPFAELPLHVLLMQNWGLTRQLAWNHPAWSISTETAAYLVFPALVLAAKWERLPSAALIALALGLGGALHLLFAMQGHATLGADIEHLGLWRCLAEFAIGNVLCLLWLRWRGLRGTAPAAGLACAAVLAAGFGFGLAETAFAPAAFATAILALALGRGPLVRALGSAAPCYLGEISYSTYLAHALLFLLFKLAFVGPSLQLDGARLAGFLLLLLAASAVLYHVVEKPAQRWLNRHRPRRALHTVPAE